MDWHHVLTTGSELWLFHGQEKRKGKKLRLEIINLKSGFKAIEKPKKSKPHQKRKQTDIEPGKSICQSNLEPKSESDSESPSSSENSYADELSEKTLLIRWEIKQQSQSEKNWLWHNQSWPMGKSNLQGGNFCGNCSWKKRWRG